MRLLRMLAILAPFALVGCSNAPGKPKPAPHEGMPYAVMEFAPLFATHCAGCHGANGNYGPAPPLNDPLFASLVPESELTHAVSDGRPGTSMPAFLLKKGGALNEAQIKVLVEGIKKNWGKTPSPTNAPPYTDSANGDVARGKALFVTACAGCHGPDGKGGSIGAIHSLGVLGLATDQALRRYIITGRPDLKMPNYAEATGRPADFKPLTNQDVADLTALLMSWKTQLAK